VSSKRVWKKLLGVEEVVVEDWDFEEVEGALVVSVRPIRKLSRRCPKCNKRCPIYDQGTGRKRCWRGLDLGTTRVFLKAAAPRIECRQHGVLVAAVPWARPGSAFTRDFEDETAWLTVHTTRKAVSELLRVAWRTVTHIVEAVGEEARNRVDLLEGLRRIGIDEVSYRKGQKYLTVVVDHQSGRLVWMHVGHDAATVGLFFEALGPERCERLDIVTADGAAWIEDAVRRHAPQALRCLDPFHVVQWGTKALDKVRREVWNDLRQAAEPEVARQLKNARWALWKNPEDLTPTQRETLGWIPKLNNSLYRAYLLKEALRGVFQAGTIPKALSRLDAWIRWARRSRLKPFMKLAKTLAVYRVRIETTLRVGMSNAIVEARNTQIRLFTRMAHGFRRVEALICLAMLKLARLCPPLPGRVSTHSSVT
jgi:transposase